MSLGGGTKGGGRAWQQAWQRATAEQGALAGLFPIPILLILSAAELPLVKERTRLESAAPASAAVAAGKATTVTFTEMTKQTYPTVRFRAQVGMAAAVTIEEREQEGGGRADAPRS